MAVATSKYNIHQNQFGSIKKLNWLVKKTLDGWNYGIHNKQQLGYDVEFEQYRSYEPGDDIRKIDWKLFARSEKLYVRLSNVAKNISFNVLLDTSNSMSYEENGISKNQYGQYLAALLFEIIKEQQDAFIFQNRKSFLKKEKVTFYKILLEGSSSFSMEQPIHLKKEKQVIILISDLYEAPDQLFNFLLKLNSSRNKVYLFRITGQNESEFSFNKKLLKDLETKDLRNYSTSEINSIKRIYNKTLADIRKFCRQKSIKIVDFDMSRQPEINLRNLIQQSRKLI